MNGVHINGVAAVYSHPVEYKDALHEQERCARSCGKDGIARLLVMEHTPVVTYGVHFRENERKTDDDELHQRGIQTFHVGRIGSSTFHGPGQLVAYPVVDLSLAGNKLKQYIRFLEGVVLAFAREYGVHGSTKSNSAGVWHRGPDGVEKKLAAIGVEVRRAGERKVALHGAAVNVNTDLSYFNLINPCGYVNGGVTSFAEILGQEISMDEARMRFVEKFICMSKIEMDLMLLEEIVREETITS